MENGSSTHVGPGFSAHRDSFSANAEECGCLQAMFFDLGHDVYERQKEIVMGKNAVPCRKVRSNPKNLEFRASQNRRCKACDIEAHWHHSEISLNCLGLSAIVMTT